MFHTERKTIAIFISLNDNINGNADLGVNPVDPGMIPDTEHETGSGRIDRDAQWQQPTVEAQWDLGQHLRDHTLYHCSLFYRLNVIANILVHHLLFIGVGNDKRALVVGS